MVARENNVYVSWWEVYEDGTRIPVFRSSHDNGMTFDQVIMLTNSTSFR